METAVKAAGWRRVGAEYPGPEQDVIRVTYEVPRPVRKVER